MLIFFTIGPLLFLRENLSFWVCLNKFRHDDSISLSRGTSVSRETSLSCQALKLRQEEPCWLGCKEAICHPSLLVRAALCCDTSWPIWRHTCAPCHVCYLPPHCPYPQSTHGDDGHNQKWTLSDLGWCLRLHRQARQQQQEQQLCLLNHSEKLLWSSRSSCFLPVTEPKALACVQYSVRT